MGLANKLSILRILLIPLFIITLAYYKREYDVLRWAALGIFALAMVSDALDGYIARRWREKTVLGSFLDPLADKLLLTSAFVCLYINSELVVRLPKWVPIVVISRDAILLLGSAILYLLKNSLEINPTVAGKMTTFFQMSTVVAVLLQFRFSFIIWSVMMVFTIFSGLDYIIKGSRLFNGGNNSRPSQCG